MLAAAGGPWYGETRCCAVVAFSSHASICGDIFISWGTRFSPYGDTVNLEVDRTGWRGHIREHWPIVGTDPNVLIWITSGQRPLRSNLPFSRDCQMGLLRLSGQRSGVPSLRDDLVLEKKSGSPKAPTTSSFHQRSELRS